MNHFVYDAYNSYRSRLDDILLVYEVLEEIPLKMGMKTVMPPFILPYYNGVVPEDCGISGFVFLAGGHFTIHTFSYRETYFIDLIYPEIFDSNRLQEIIKSVFPAEKVSSFTVERGKRGSFLDSNPIDEKLDFGPHLFMDLSNYDSPQLLDELFDIFDILPCKIGMTPIMRPYAVKSKIGQEKVISILTMIAESHISLHYFKESKKAYLDLFSCKFFNYSEVIDKLKTIFKGTVDNEVLLSRGRKYQQYRNRLDVQYTKSKKWIENI